jgi:hypothetical protein
MIATARYLSSSSQTHEPEINMLKFSGTSTEVIVQIQPWPVGIYYNLFYYKEREELEHSGTRTASAAVRLCRVCASDPSQTPN